jgi:hypothetical protein
MSHARLRCCAVLVLLALAAACRDTAGPNASLVPAAISGATTIAFTGSVGSTLPVSVRVTSAQGEAIANVSVGFAVTGGSGSVAPATVVTDANGQASTTWTLGTTAGTQTLSASVVNLQPVTFSATARPGPPTGMGPAAGHSQHGTVNSAVLTRPAVRVTDTYGNGVAGVAVQFAVTAGGGVASGTAQTTNNEGIATVGDWILGSVVGSQRLSATAPGLAPVHFTAQSLSQGFNLLIEAVHLNQGSQTLPGGIGAVSGRGGLLRVVVRASEANTLTPSVRLRFFQGTTLLREQTIEAPGSGVPRNVDISDLRQTWNLQLSAAEVVPGLAVEAVVDANGAIPDINRADNRFPREAGSISLDAVALAPLRIVFFPIHATVQGVTGSITNANVETFLEATRQWIPSSTVAATVRSPFTTGLDLRVGSSWNTLLADLQAVRTAEGARDEYYHGIIGDFSGIPYGGLAYRPSSPGSTFRSGLSYDRHPFSTGTIAHELGHNLGRLHAPCGNPPNVDPNFPHPNGALGSPGFDILRGIIHAPNSNSDYMSYCRPRWTSDYTYRGILQWRRQDPLARWDGATGNSATSGETEGLLLWGRIGSGGVMLNPAFALAGEPVLPREGGPNELRGIAADGTVLFQLAFAGVSVMDGSDPDERHFAFLVPLRRSDLDRIERIELATPRGNAVHRRSVPAEAHAEHARPAIRLESRPGNRVRVRWDANLYPAALVRDPNSGHVLSIARGGDLEIATGARAADRIEVILSDGVRSRVGTPR